MTLMLHVTPSWAGGPLNPTSSDFNHNTAGGVGALRDSRHEDDPYVKAAIVTPSKTTYVRNHVTPGQDQLMKATVRLAALLNAIEWK